VVVAQGQSGSRLQVSRVSERRALALRAGGGAGDRGLGQREGGRSGELQQHCSRVVVDWGECSGADEAHNLFKPNRGSGWVWYSLARGDSGTQEHWRLGCNTRDSVEHYQATNCMTILCIR
jgi:hypothetical protein